MNNTKNCHFCTNNVQYVDFKDVETLKKFIDPYARIMNHKRSGTCSKHQRKLAEALKRARFMAFLPYIAR